MKVAVFSTKRYDREALDRANAGRHVLQYLEPRLDETTSSLAAGCAAVCPFVNDQLDEEVLTALVAGGVRSIVLRCAGFNHVDLVAAKRLALVVARVPAYSPHAVAEHTIGLILALNRNIHRAYNRVREGNFSLDGLLGFDLHGRTVGVVGTGKIGTEVVRILVGFGCRIVAFDPFPSEACRALGAEFVTLDALLREADIVTLHCPLTRENDHLIDAPALARMKAGAMLINTSRGRLIDTRAVIAALKTRQLGSLGLDVYEEEGEMFFEDRSGMIIDDDVFTRLLTFPNVIITGHQGFFTREALDNIATTTIANLTELEKTGTCANVVQTP